MPVYVDPIRWIPKGKVRHSSYGPWWCRLATDEDLDTLHAFAEQIDLGREWFRKSRRPPFYDLTRDMRQKAVDAGAIEVTARELTQRCRSTIE